MGKGLIDLHIHSTFSDGSHPPYQIVRMAKEMGLEAISITDHDQTAGNEEGARAAREHGIKFVPGVEISVSYKGRKSHLLGYFIDWENRGIKEALALCRTFREERNPLIVEKLRGLGFDLTYEEVKALVKGDVVGKPHFAEVMVRKGYVKDQVEAFEKYLKTGALASVEKKRIPAEEGIRLIKGAGGIPVLAHPGDDDVDFERVRERVVDFQRLDVMGVEVHYSRHSPEMRRFLLDLTRSLGLIPTGGSDFHGEGKKGGVRLGSGFGDLRVPVTFYRELLKEWENRAFPGRPVTPYG